ncbi:MAG: hypothetical protein ACT4PJ_09380 [Gemmatimonadaceae bacterium]
MSRTIVPTALVIAFALGTTAEAQSLIPGQTRMRVGVTSLTVGPLTNGQVLVEVWRGMDRIIGQVPAQTLAHWADSSWSLVDSRSGIALRAVTYDYPDGSTKIEYKSPYLSLGAEMALVLDRVDRDGTSRFALYATDDVRERRVYIIMSRSEVSTLLEAMRDVVAGPVATSVEIRP